METGRLACHSILDGMTRSVGYHGTTGLRLAEVPFSIAMDIQSPASLVRMLFHLVQQKAAHAKRMVVLDMADAAGPAVADHMPENIKDSAVEFGRRRRVISLNPFRAGAGTRERMEARRCYLQATSHLVKDSLAPTASSLVEMALDVAATLNDPSPLLAMEAMTDPGLRCRAFRDRDAGQRRRAWTTSLQDPAVFSSAIAWMGRSLDALCDNGIAEFLAPVKVASRLADIIHASRITHVVIPEHQPGVRGRLALLELVAFHVEEAYASRGEIPEDGAGQPCLAVLGVSGKELDILARTLHGLRASGCPLCIECGRVLRCDGRSLRLLASAGSGSARCSPPNTYERKTAISSCRQLERTLIGDLRGKVFRFRIYWLPGRTRLIECWGR